MTEDATATFLIEQRTAIIDRADRALHEAHSGHYESLDPLIRRDRLETLYDRLRDAAVSRDLSEVVAYGRQLAEERFAAGYDLSEVQVAINALEESIWMEIFAELAPAEFAGALGLVSTVLGAIKDALAREYVSLATHAHAPSLDLRTLFAGTG
jgi:hypothetical protein